MKRWHLFGIVAVAGLLLFGCTPAASPTSTTQPPTVALLPTATSMPTATSQPVAAPTQTPANTSTAIPTPTDAPPIAVAPDAITGQQLWPNLPCPSCHGASAEGAFGPKLAGTALSEDQVLARVRAGKPPMPAFAADQVSDADVKHVYAWLRSLAAPTATPEPSDTPTQTATSAPTSTPSAVPQPTMTSEPATGTPMPPTATPLPTATPVPPTDTPLPTETPLPPTETPLPTATPTEVLPADPDPATGKRVWAQQPCVGCHGADAQGVIGPRLAGTGISFDQLLGRVRLGKGVMPAFTEDQVSDLALRHIYSWLRSMAPPTPTPISAPSFPTGALLNTWNFVNEMRIRADFAKDLPERLAADDAGRLGVLKTYSGDGLNQTQIVLAQANQAINEVPNENVRAILRQIIDQTNTVIGLFNQALGQNSFGSAWPIIAEAVRICRLDTLPLATQAVRDAGVVGSINVQVTNRNGNPISGALVTVLTAHTPLAGRTDGSGRASFVNVAAIPALMVKAYDSGIIYHEVNANLSPGATASVAIVLPGASIGGQTPAVSDATISPASGAGNATVTFGLTATDPQGALDLAEDQIFALNADLGLAYVLRRTGGNRYEARVTLPNLPAGLHTWRFFAVDHACNTSNILTVRFTVQ